VARSGRTGTRPTLYPSSEVQVTRFGPFLYDDEILFDCDAPAPSRAESPQCAGRDKRQNDRALPHLSDMAQDPQRRSSVILEVTS
jgi:hypothetical protein